MELHKIRSTVVKAIFSDDFLTEKLVLKGGNALDLIYNFEARSSLDLDFSTEEDFDDLEDLERRVTRCLKDRFDSIGYLVFDIKVETRPKSGADPKWGGYAILFKIIEKKQAVGLNKEELRRNALLISGRSSIGKIEVSKFEFCEGAEEREFDHFPVRVYTLPMIAAEKLRAICRQMPEMRPKPARRARDFFDIYTITVKSNLDIKTPENQLLLKKVFAAKDVPIPLLWKISTQRDVHSIDWSAVELSASGKVEDFDFYFDFVCKEVEHLKACWIE